MPFSKCVIRYRASSPERLDAIAEGLSLCVSVSGREFHINMDEHDKETQYRLLTCFHKPQLIHESIFLVDKLEYLPQKEVELLQRLTHFVPYDQALSFHVRIASSRKDLTVCTSMDWLVDHAEVNLSDLFNVTESVLKLPSKLRSLIIDILRRKTNVRTFILICELISVDHTKTRSELKRALVSHIREVLGNNDILEGLRVELKNADKTTPIPKCLISLLENGVLKAKHCPHRPNFPDSIINEIYREIILSCKNNQHSNNNAS